MTQKTELVICLGSSCFARGNKKLLAIVQRYIKENQYEDRVNLKGCHCCGKCINGPVLKIGEKCFEDLNESTIIEILAKELN